jgi:hypothetical protein
MRPAIFGDVNLTDQYRSAVHSLAFWTLLQSSMASPSVKADLVIQFEATADKASKEDARNKASQALNEYNELLATLHSAGFLAAGKQGNMDGEILVIVSCPWEKLTVLVEAERLAPRA